MLLGSTTDALSKPQTGSPSRWDNLCVAWVSNFLICVSFFGDRGEEASMKNWLFFWWSNRYNLKGFCVNFFFLICWLLPDWSECCAFKIIHKIPGHSALGKCGTGWWNQVFTVFFLAGRTPSTSWNTSTVHLQVGLFVEYCRMTENSELEGTQGQSCLSH